MEKICVVVFVERVSSIRELVTHSTPCTMTSLRTTFQVTLVGASLPNADDGMMSKADPFMTFEFGR
jgi:hypothetical protein